MKKIIAIDDGHGMQTAGKRTPIFPSGHKYAGQFMHENHFNREVAKLLGEHLVVCGFDVLFTTRTDEDTPLKERTDLANNTTKNKFNKSADIFVSIHANANTGVWGSSKGIETLVQIGQLNKESGRLAKVIHKRVLGGTSFSDRGLKEANLHVTRAAKMPSVLLELGFMDNLREAELLMDGSYRKECAIEIAQGICDYFSTPFVMTNEEKIKGVVENFMKTYSKYFDDVQLEWMASSVDYCKENGIIGGKEDNKFDPKSPITRGEMAVVLKRTIDFILNQK